MDVSVIIVNYNGMAVLPSCLSSLKKQTGVHFEIIIVDNDSQDGSLFWLNKQDGIVTVPQSENLGFGKAINIATQIAQGQYFYFINPDAILLEEDSLAKLFEFMLANPKVGLAGTQVITPSKGLTHPRRHYLQHHALLNHNRALPGKIAWVIGASIIVSKETFNIIEGFDEAFFLYGEEVDLCLRVRQAGYEIGYCEHIAVKHIGGGSSGDKPNYFLTSFRKQKAQQLLYKKHYQINRILPILRKEKLRAKFRAFIYKIVLLFRKKNSDWARLQHYLAIEKATTEMLSEKKS